MLETRRKGGRVLARVAHRFRRPPAHFDVLSHSAEASPPTSCRRLSIRAKAFVDGACRMLASVFNAFPKGERSWRLSGWTM